MFDNKSMTDVYVSIRGRLMKSVSKIVPPKDIEDIVQETYVRVCQIESSSDIKYPRSFLFKTAKNLALDHVKRAESRLTSGVADDDDFDVLAADVWRDDPYDNASSNGDFAFFCDAVRHLPVQCRRVFVLKKVYGYSQKEISETLGISQSTVEKHISTGVRRCAKFMMNAQQNDNEFSALASSVNASEKIVSIKAKEGGRHD